MNGYLALGFYLEHFDDMDLFFLLGECPDEAPKAEWAKLETVMDMAAKQVETLLRQAIDGAEEAFAPIKCRFELVSRMETMRKEWQARADLFLPHQRKPHASVWFDIGDQSRPALTLWVSFDSDRRIRGREFSEHLRCDGLAADLADGRSDLPTGAVLLGEIPLTPPIKESTVRAMAKRFVEQTVVEHWPLFTAC